jgi:NAD(P)-dependent dehydrogenase (short-subunit alcohol dehydrogenase family)
MGRLEGRAAIVTGGGRGLGATFAAALAAEGAMVAVADIVDTGKTVASVEQAGGRAIGLHCDVTEPPEVREMVAATVQAFGRIDILVANAALFADLERKPFLEIEEEEWDRVMRVNTRGVFTCAKHVVPEMRKNGYGKIVTIASGTVFKGAPNFAHYVASKGAVVAFTRSLAREVGGDGICANVLAPGQTMSESMADQEQVARIKDAIIGTRAIQREETPRDLIGALLFLCSADSDFVTGQTLVVDGGSVMR